YMMRRMLGAWIYTAIFVGTVLWSFYEVGATFWGWVPRMAPILVLGFFAALLAPRLALGRSRAGYALAVVQLLVLVAGAVAMFFPHGAVSNTAELADAPPVVADAADPANAWKHYGRTPAGTRYAPFAQINRDNVSQLEVAWT